MVDSTGFVPNLTICPERTDEPHIVVSSSATSDIEGDTRSGFTVAAGNPEALASAAMLISKGRYAAA